MSDERFTNRELSWIQFNDRVVQLASEPGIPLLERAKFCAIASTNLDEFFQVRVAALKDQIVAGIDRPSPDGRTPAQTLAEVGHQVLEFVDRVDGAFVDQLVPELRAAGIDIISWTDVTSDERAELDDWFDERVFPVLTPLAVDPGHPFPYISDLALSLAVNVADPESGERRFARLKVPKLFPRLGFLPCGDRSHLGRRDEQGTGLGAVIGGKVDRGLGLPALTGADAARHAGALCQGLHQPKRAHGLIPRRACQHFEGKGDQAVPGQYSQRLSICAVDRRPAAPGVGVVESGQVVMNKTGAMYQLQRCCRRIRQPRPVIATGKGDRQQDGGPDPRAARHDRMVKCPGKALRCVRGIGQTACRIGHIPCGKLNGICNGSFDSDR